MRSIRERRAVPPRRTIGSRLRRRRDDRGAALVEFALIAMPLFLILFGTIEFGWAFFQLNDIRHGAREGMRLAVVASDVVPTESYSGEGERIAQATCERMDQRDGVHITIAVTDLDSPTNGYDVGDDATITAWKDLDQLTMVFDPVLGGVKLEEVVTSRLEQDPPPGIEVTDYPCK